MLIKQVCNLILWRDIKRQYLGFIECELLIRSHLSSKFIDFEFCGNASMVPQIFHYLIYNNSRRGLF